MPPTPPTPKRAKTPAPPNRPRSTDEAQAAQATPAYRDAYRILGIDPGSQKTGAAVLEVDRPTGASRFIAIRYRQLQGKDFGERLLDLDQWLTIIARSFRTEVFAWEAQYSGKRNWSTMRQLAKANGVVELVCAKTARFGFECAPTSSRKAVFRGDMNYEGMRAILAEDYDIAPEMLASIEEDAISSMIQAAAVKILLCDRIPRSGIKLVYGSKTLAGSPPDGMVKSKPLRD